LKIDDKATELMPKIERRIIVVGIVKNDLGQYLICKMPEGRGVFPDQWGLPGGGIEEDERMDAALRRELMEELGIQVSHIRPLFFSDGTYKKSFANGEARDIYMIFLIFECNAMAENIHLSDEFSQYAWVDSGSLSTYALNEATITTFRRAGVIN
jgi:nucleoside triphosphatase